MRLHTFALLGCLGCATSTGVVPFAPTKYQPRPKDYPIALYSAQLPTCQIGCASIRSLSSAASGVQPARAWSLSHLQSTSRDPRITRLHCIARSCPPVRSDAPPYVRSPRLPRVCNQHGRGPFRTYKVPAETQGLPDCTV